MLIVKALKTTLHTPLSSSGASLVLKKFVDLDGTELTMADFGDFGVIVLKQGDTVEMIKFSALSQSSTDATCTLTVASSGRSIAGTSPYAGAATGLDFNAGAEAIISNDPLTLSRFANLDIAQTFEKIMTFAALPRTTAGNPVDVNDLARKAYVDSVVAGIATTVNLIVSGIAGETVAAGNLIYLKAADGRWWKCDADTATTVENVNLGIAQGAGTAGVAITNGILTQGLDSNQSALTASTKYYAGNTAGAISTTTGTKEVTIGFSHPTDATKLYFQPRFDQQLTENQQDLVEQIEAGTDWYAASAVGTDSYAITIAPAITAYVTGMKFRFKADVGNTSVATLAVSGLAAKNIKKFNDQDLVTGDIEVGQIVSVVYDGTNFQMQSQVAIVSATIDIQVFTSSGTWTKPAGALAVEVYVVGGGGGGGSGRKSSANSQSGGSGGGGGSLGFKRFNASGLASTETVTIGAGGAGGAGQAVADTNGNAGSVGGDTTFGTTALLVAKGGAGGIGGSIADGAGGAGGVIGNGDIQVVGGAGGGGRIDDFAGNTGVDTASAISPRGGGAGGGFSTSFKLGGIGGGFITNYVKAGGAIGTIGGSSITLFYGGTGGGGSTAAATSAVGGVGIEGSGGGGSGLGTTASGNGGAGGVGFIIVISYL